MKVLVTGASGFIGSHVAERLATAGHEVRVLVRGTSNLRWLSGKPFEVVTGDPMNIESLRDAVSNVDAIVHVAGVTAAKTKQDFFNGNQLVTRNLIEAARRYAPGLVTFVHCSSQTAVGPSLDGQPVTENTPPHPITTYGLSKRAAEEECEQARADLPITILRLPAVYGPRDTAILSFFQTVDKRLKPLIGMQDKKVTLSHVADIAEGVLLALESEAARNQTYFLGSERPYTWREVSDLTAEIIGKRGLTLRLPHAIVYTVAGLSEIASMFRSQPSVLNWEKGRDLVQQHWTASIDKARRELGYGQIMSLEDGIRDTTEWYRKHGWM